MEPLNFFSKSPQGFPLKSVRLLLKLFFVTLLVFEMFELVPYFGQPVYTMLSLLFCSVFFIVFFSFFCYISCFLFTLCLFFPFLTYYYVFSQAKYRSFFSQFFRRYVILPIYVYTIFFFFFIDSKSIDLLCSFVNMSDCWK